MDLGPPPKTRDRLPDSSPNLDRDTAAKLVEEDHKLVRFFIPGTARWPQIAKVTTGLGQYLTDAVRAVARENPRLQGVVDVTDFNATTAGQRIVDGSRLTTPQTRPPEKSRRGFGAIRCPYVSRPVKMPL